MWTYGLFAALATHVLLLLQLEPANRKALGLDFDKGELVVVVCAPRASRRQALFNSIWARSRRTNSFLHNSTWRLSAAQSM